MIFGLLLLFSSAFARTVTTYQPYYYPAVPRAIYNPYSNGYYPYNAARRHVNNLRNIPQNKYYNPIGWFKRAAKGVLTGYTVPINQDIYKQMGISPYDPYAKQKQNSINCNQNLYSLPSGREYFYNDGRYIKDLNGIESKTGVTIIYD